MACMVQGVRCAVCAMCGVCDVWVDGVVIRGHSLEAIHMNAV